MALLLGRALQSELVVKSAKVAAESSKGNTKSTNKASPADALVSVALVDVLKLRLLELVATGGI